MKQTSRAARVLVGAAAMLMAGGTAQALQINVTRTSGYFSGSGGEYTLTVVSGSITHLAYHGKAMANGGFQSFCLEKDESITPGRTYNAVPSTRAMHGGVGPAGDPISLGTAWLYSQFALGTLANYAYTPLGNGPAGPNNGRAESAKLLQEAIWCLEDEAACNGANVFVNMAVTRFGSLADAKRAANGAFGVLALNLTTTTRAAARRQDMLVHVVPEPASMLLLGSGLLGLPLLHRRPGRTRG